MTLDFDKYKGAERFHGQKKMHLNNANEDASFLREWVAGEIARAAGVPAGRCTHAMVSINGKDKGLYVVRESFTKDFLMSHFGEDKGGLFEGHFCKDLDLELELDSGPDTAREALKELLAACEVPDATARWERLSKVLDVDAFAAHLAMEQVLDFWDSYDFNGTITGCTSTRGGSVSSCTGWTRCCASPRCRCSGSRAAGWDRLSGRVRRACALSEEDHGDLREGAAPERTGPRPSRRAPTRCRR
jgi:hypothetical protein